jgi:hypothetical protein
MEIKYPWPAGPWQWVDSHDDQPICPFIDPDNRDGDPKPISEVAIEGEASLRTIAKSYDGFTVSIVDADPSFCSGDAPYVALQAFPEVADALIAFVKAVDPFIQSEEPAKLKDMSRYISAAYKEAIMALRKAGAIVGHEEQLELPFDIPVSAGGRPSGAHSLS